MIKGGSENIFRPLNSKSYVSQKFPKRGENKAKKGGKCPPNFATSFLQKILSSRRNLLEMLSLFL